MTSGAGAYGYFQPYDDWLAGYTVARFLIDPAVQTPVFVRFSTVAGSRGSADTVRDVRGFATKFYTTQGNYDLVGNNMPVFFIRGAIPELLAPGDGTVRGADGEDVTVDRAITTMASVVYDAVIVPGAQASVDTLSADGYAVHFVAEAIRHAKPVGALGAGTALVERAAAGTLSIAQDSDSVTDHSGIIAGYPGTAIDELPA